MGNFKIFPFHHYVLRTPLFPIAFYKNIITDYSIENLLLQIENEYVREAIHLASPELLVALDKWKLNPSNISGKKK